MIAAMALWLYAILALALVLSAVLGARSFLDSLAHPYAWIGLAVWLALAFAVGLGIERLKRRRREQSPPDLL